MYNIFFGIYLAACFFGIPGTILQMWKTLPGLSFCISEPISLEDYDHFCKNFNMFYLVYLFQYTCKNSPDPPKNNIINNNSKLNPWSVYIQSSIILQILQMGKWYMDLLDFVNPAGESVVPCIGYGGMDRYIFGLVIRGGGGKNKYYLKSAESSGFYIYGNGIPKGYLHPIEPERFDHL